jgi:hypothetical protein
MPATHLWLHPFPVRPGRPFATMFHLFSPYFCTKSIRTASSCTCNQQATQSKVPIGDTHPSWSPGMLCTAQTKPGNINVNCCCAVLYRISSHLCGPRKTRLGFRHAGTSPAMTPLDPRHNPLIRLEGCPRTAAAAELPESSWHHSSSHHQEGVYVLGCGLTLTGPFRVRKPFA